MPGTALQQSKQDQSYVGLLDIRGRNGSDSTFLINDQQCLEAYNVDFYRAGLARKRGGSQNLSLATSGTAFSGGAVSMSPFLPSDDQTARELWAIDGAMVFHRLAASVTWADVPLLDTCSGFPQEVDFQSFNGKLFVAMKNAHNRLHCWDGTSLRRVGLDLPGALVSIVLAGGTITDTRQYRISWTKQNGSGVTTDRSNLNVASASQVMATQQATITRPAPPGEGETHWELWAASTTSAFGDWRLQATTVIATTTAVDNAALGPTVSPDDGQNTPPPSARYLIADDARVIMAGAYETAANAENAMAPKSSRVWWTSPLGSSDAGDDERISNTGTINAYADLEEAVTGMSEPMQVVNAAATSLERGSFYVFSLNSQWKFITTGDATTPYLKFRITGGGGCVHHKSIVTSIDANGNPAIYWWSPFGPFRISANGQEFLGEDVVDITATMNFDATVPCHNVYYPTLRQVWFYIATGTNMYPDTRVVFDTRLGRPTQVSGVRMGWSVHVGAGTQAYCSCLFSDVVAATMGRTLKPYIGYSGGTAIWKSDTGTDDVGTPYMAYIDSKSYAPWGLNRLGGTMNEPTVIANPAQGVTLRLTMYRNEGAESAPANVDLTDRSDAASALKVFAKAENAKLADSWSFRCRIGDAQTISNAWTLDALIVPVMYQGEN